MFQLGMPLERIFANLTGIPDGSCLRRVRCHGEVELKPELRTLIGNAFDADLPTHEMHQFRRDGQAQARTAEFPGVGVIDLGKRLKQFVLLVRSDTDSGVSDAQPQPAKSFVSDQGTDRHHDSSVPGELGRVLQ